MSKTVYELNDCYEQNQSAKKSEIFLYQSMKKRIRCPKNRLSEDNLLNRLPFIKQYNKVIMKLIVMNLISGIIFNKEHITLFITFERNLIFM